MKMVRQTESRGQRREGNRSVRAVLVTKEAERLAGGEDTEKRKGMEFLTKEDSIWVKTLW